MVAVLGTFAHDGYRYDLETARIDEKTVYRYRLFSPTKRLLLCSRWRPRRDDTLRAAERVVAIFSAPASKAL